MLPDEPGWVVGDRGDAADAFRQRIEDLGARPAIPYKKTDAPVAGSAWVGNNRNIVERPIGRLKQFHRIATRHEKRAANHLAMIIVAAVLLWL